MFNFKQIISSIADVGQKLFNTREVKKNDINSILDLCDELECDSVSGEISYGNLVDIVDVKPIEKSPSSIQNSSIIKEFIQAGNSLKKQQIEVLLENNFQLLAEEYKTDEIMIKRKIKRLPTIVRVTYKALSEFLSIYYS